MSKTLVPFVPGGMDTNLAEVIGLTRDGEQVVLRVEYNETNPMTGAQTILKRIFQRDRKEIESLTRDGKQARHTLRMLRSGYHKSGVTMD